MKKQLWIDRTPMMEVNYGTWVSIQNTCSHPEHMQPYKSFSGMARNPDKFRDLFYKKRVMLYDDVQVINRGKNEIDLDYELRVLREIDLVDINAKLIISDIDTENLFEDLEKVQGMSRKFITDKEVDNIIEFLPATYNTLNLRISNRDNRMLFINTNYHPSWRAYIHEKEVPVYRGYFNFMAVPIPRGNFDLEMKFIPKYSYIGLIVSLTTLFFIIFIISFIHYRKKRALYMGKLCGFNIHPFNTLLLPAIKSKRY